MYYLLENNKIIDSKELSNSGVHINIKENVMYLDSWLGTRFYGTIKKQSENVYDLIDWDNDLVRVDNMIHQCKYFHRDLREEYIENQWINAIYKPDEKGNYIKVWEKTK